MSLPPSEIVYLDNGATTAVDPAVFDSMVPLFLSDFGNASSSHRLGVAARSAIDAARRTFADLLGCSTAEIVFTSGGTEADNLAMRGVADLARGRHAVMTDIEHPAILSQREVLTARGFDVTVVPVERDGRVLPEAIASAVTGDTALVAVMLANNEIGTVQPIEAIGAAIKRRNPDVAFVVDAVQAFTKMPLPIHAAHIDLLALSSHKIHGPKGVGALYVRKGTRLAPQVTGGSQEHGIRPGTENVPGIVGFARAAAIASEHAAAEQQRMRELRDHLIAEAVRRLPPVTLNGHPEHRLCNNASLNFHGAPAQVLLQMAEAEGLFASAGAACHASSRKPSHVLQAVGLDADEGTLRLTLSRHTTDRDIERALDILDRIVPRARQIGAR
jgi:cysteine desulfurase